MKRIHELQNRMSCQQNWWCLVLINQTGECSQQDMCFTMTHFPLVNHQGRKSIKCIARLWRSSHVEFLRSSRFCGWPNWQIQRKQNHHWRLLKTSNIVDPLDPLDPLEIPMTFSHRASVPVGAWCPDLLGTLQLWMVPLRRETVIQRWHGWHHSMLTSLPPMLTWVFLDISWIWSELLINWWMYVDVWFLSAGFCWPLPHMDPMCPVSNVSSP